MHLAIDMALETDLGSISSSPMFSGAIRMNPPSGRPWLQFSLRSLLIVMLVVASFLAGRMSRLAEERAMRAEMEARYAATLAKEQQRFAELRAAYPAEDSQDQTSE